MSESRHLFVHFTFSVTVFYQLLQVLLRHSIKSGCTFYVVLRWPCAIDRTLKSHYGRTSLHLMFYVTERIHASVFYAFRTTRGGIPRRPNFNFLCMSQTQARQRFSLLNRHQEARMYRCSRRPLQENLAHNFYFPGLLTFFFFFFFRSIFDHELTYTMNRETNFCL